MHDISTGSLVRLLLEYRNSNPYSTVELLQNQEANELNYSEPFAFILACSIDRQMPYEVVWLYPLWIKQKLGQLSPELLAGMSVVDLEGLIRQMPRCHRFPRQAAETIQDLSRQVMLKYSGDASRLWQAKSIKEIKSRLMSIRGVGPGITDMTLNILLREGWLCIESSEYSRIDVKPDVHVQRVFYRTGLSDSQDERAAIIAARRAYPEYPGKLDQPAWQIGLKYCSPNSPSCSECPLSTACLRKGLS